MTGVISKGTPLPANTPDDTIPQRNATAPAAPAAPLAPQIGTATSVSASSMDDTGRGRKVITPAPSSTPLDRYSQTHIPIEVRERIRVIVREVVEESMAPLLRWQKDMEVRLERERVRSAAAGPPSSASPYSNSGAPSANPPIVVDRASFNDPFMPVAAPAARPSTLDFAPTPGGPVDVPLELDGGRRKRSVIWIVATIVLLLLVGFLSATATSQMR